MRNSQPIFISGATGSIGSALLKRLSESGQPIRALVRNAERASHLRGMANVDIVLGDLGEPDRLRGCVAGCSVAYHCAAKMSGMDRAASYAVNVTGTQALADEAVRSGVERFVFTSTVGVYGTG